MKKEVFNRRTPGVTTTEVAIIKSMLDSTPVGGVVSYESMSESLGRDIRIQCVTALYRALKESLNEGKVFDVIPTEGYKRLEDNAIVDNSARFFRHIKRTSTKVSARLASVNLERLDESRKSEYFSQISMAGALMLFSAPSSIRKVGEKSPSGVLPVGKVMELFQ